MSKKESDKLSIIAGESAIQFVGTVARVPLYYLLAILLTRSLGPDSYGLWSLTESVYRVISVLVLFGMPRALYRFVAYYQGVGKSGKTKSLITGGFVFSILIGIVIQSVWFFVPTTVVDQYFQEEGLGRLLRLITLGLPFNSLLLSLSSCYIGFKKVRYQVLTEVVGLPLIQVVLALLIFKGFKTYNVISWAWTYVSSLLIALLMSLFLFLRKVWPTLRTVQSRPVEYRTIIGYAWPLTIYTVLNIVAQEVDLVLLGAFGSARDVGVYRVYLYFIMPLQFVMGSLGRIYQPVATELVAQKKMTELASVFSRTSKWMIQINLFLVMVILFLGETLVLILFGKEYLVAPAALLIMALGRVANSSAGPTLMTLEAFGMSNRVLLNSVFQIVLRVGLAYLLIPRLGLTGASISGALSLFMANYFALFQVWQLYKISPFTRDYRRLLLIGILSSGIGTVAQLWLRFEFPILSTLIAFLLSVLSYWGMLFVSGVVDYEDRRVVKGLFKRLLVRLT